MFESGGGAVTVVMPMSESITPVAVRCSASTSLIERRPRFSVSGVLSVACTPLQDIDSRQGREER